MYGRNADLAAERDAILSLPPDQQQAALMAMSQRRSSVPAMPGGFREPTADSEGGAYTEGLPPASGVFADVSRAFQPRNSSAGGFSEKRGEDTAAGGASSSSNPLSGLPAGMQSILSQQRDLNRRAGENARGIADVEQQQRERIAKGERDSSRAYADTQRQLTQDFERRQRPIPEFIPTQETARDIGTLASLLMVAGATLGGKARGGALMAVQSMTGMMNGYRQGRQDLYQRERQNFETGVRQVQAQNQQLQQAFERAQRLAQTDLDAAQRNFRLEAVELGADLPRLAGERANIEGTRQTLQTGMTLVAQIEQRKAAAEQAAAVRRQTAEDARRTSEQNFVRAQGPEAAEIYRLTGQAIPKAPAERIYGSARAMAEGAAIADEASRLPENMGRSGQVRGFFERWFTSSQDAVRNNRPAPSPELTEAERRALPDGEQRALLFAKRYAAYLVNYERNLAGGARGFTVSFQNRFNTLMSQEQFSRQGFVDLMRQHVQELAQGSQLPGLPEFNFDRLATIGTQLHDQGSMAGERGSAARGFELLRQNNHSAPSPPPGPRPPPVGNVQDRQRDAAQNRANEPVRITDDDAGRAALAALPPGTDVILPNGVRTRTRARPEPQ
jgi:hypothetical protein